MFFSTEKIIPRFSGKRPNQDQQSVLVVIETDGVQQSLGDCFLVLDLFFFKTSNRDQRVDGRPLSKVPVPVELEGAVELQLPGHFLRNGGGDDAEILQGGKAGGQVGQLGLKTKTILFT